jgi:Fe-S cluster assembly iron-binding protein IscA
MLTLTPTAADAVRSLVAGMDVDDDTGGLRISPGEATETGHSLALALVDGPEAADDQVEEGGANVFLEPMVTEYLDDKVLDANVESGRVQFVILQQGHADPGLDGGPPA